MHNQNKRSMGISTKYKYPTIRLLASRGLRKCLISRIKFTTGTRIVSKFYLYCQLLPHGATIKKERVLRYRIIYEERTYLSWRGVVGRAERKGPRLNKREYLGVNVACRRRSHVTPIDILSSIISFANLTFLSLLHGKHCLIVRRKLSLEIFIHSIFFVVDDLEKKNDRYIVNGRYIVKLKTREA